MEGFTRARLIPVKGIGSDQEAEERATSALLAVIGIVRPLSIDLFSPFGASKATRAQVETFTEVLLDLDGQRCRPDGLVRITYGGKPWTALVEVKTGTNALEAEQILTYLRLARSNGFDAVVTISNEIAPAPGAHPTPGVQPRSNSRVKLHHLSWTQVVTTAVRLKEHTGVEDAEQRWILDELIRYLEHRSSGALAFNDMGGSWVAVRNGAKDGTLSRASGEVHEVCQRWDQLMRYIALVMSAQMGQDVLQVLNGAHRTDPRARVDSLAKDLATHGTLTAALKIPNTTGPLDITADLKAGQVLCSTSVKAPEDKGPRGRVGWLVRQLKEAPDDLQLESRAHRAKSGPLALLGAVREDSKALIDDQKRNPAAFHLVRRYAMGTGRKAGGRGKQQAFIDSVEHAINDFYDQVLSRLTAWQPKPSPRSSVSEPPDVQEFNADV